MMTSVKFSMLLLGVVLAVSAAGPAGAQEWTRKTVNGGEINRGLTDEGGGIFSGSTTRTGVNGGTYTSTSTCANGVVARCSRSYSGVTANGKTFSGQSLSAHGPFRTRSVGTFTGPGGSKWYGFRRFRR
ncbi:hypothetical protein LB566_26875 [Mesorhizobium sp. CA13]|uniref:hypothetical protein n=1 Tax=unclassified Mesorhizobium TaxID=325217 RepID=UPI001CCDAE3C|nr:MULTISPECIES: hypothetical protein [unclassified Mesorhizobium]MBZ9857414.1 hypothetical protein [Mesorhizobium sp. CA13]MBZ9921844.1 hypothetical protein [Mesorhizobium sp. BR1-1-7]MBZ9966622.1 hypothetical protein [Mesorhizobium sp. BR1-1-2]